MAREVWWGLQSNGILAPGKDPNNDDLPNFHLTPLSGVFIQTGEWPVYDPDSYLARLIRTTANPDSTVLAYLAEGLRSFKSGNFVASALMVDIAAERAFILLCQSTLDSLANAKEKAEFKKIMALSDEGETRLGSSKAPDRSEETTIGLPRQRNHRDGCYL
ncbi:MAG TPA: hypothetical protein VNS63_09960 [Blastocatellia bacterium]|nr:hypothetical protein [Blastocatellia bacterium]